MKIYVTKYALTQGIFEEPNAIGHDHNVFSVSHAGYCDSYYHKGEYALTKEEAIAQAEAMRLKKIKSLNAQLLRLNSLKFED